MPSVIFTDQHSPNGNTIRYNVDADTQTVKAQVEACLRDGTFIEIPNEYEGFDPIFLNPERVATISPQKED